MKAKDIVIGEDYAYTASARYMRALRVTVLETGVRPTAWAIKANGVRVRHTDGKMNVVASVHIVRPWAEHLVTQAQRDAVAERQRAFAEEQAGRHNAALAVINKATGLELERHHIWLPHAEKIAEVLTRGAK